jgi:hypothetical protein
MGTDTTLLTPNELPDLAAICAHHVTDGVLTNYLLVTPGIVHGLVRVSGLVRCAEVRCAAISWLPHDSSGGADTSRIVTQVVRGALDGFLLYMADNDGRADMDLDPLDCAAIGLCYEMTKVGGRAGWKGGQPVRGENRAK